ncbi:unnamed protein product [Effrenium voratum]|uniref:Uncharacterized protein n=1 Tax=Effrenium voratum TaxID=2562239 RepID=A0AA36JEA2_9DINO|nr:unnamed protein product [Effrenium voratum]CAJ1404099.1 unnamed protein product [Effrenium voratum]CAJ1451918.1 unnamed protein product [Effrenium voratum]
MTLTDGQDCDDVSDTSWDMIGDDATLSDCKEWFLVSGSRLPASPRDKEMRADDSPPGHALQEFLGPLELNGVDYSQISFLLGEWMDSFGHSVSVVATSDRCARVHQVNGHWVCGNGQLSAADVGRVQWQRPNGERTEWIRTFPVSAAFLSAYVRPRDRKNTLQHL